MDILIFCGDYVVVSFMENGFFQLAPVSTISRFTNVYFISSDECILIYNKDIINQKYFQTLID